MRRLAAQESERTAKDIMDPIPTIRTEAPLAEAAALIVKGRGNIVAVLDAHDKIAGILTTWDVTRAVAEGRHDDRLDAIMSRR